ncbi:TBC1 domain family member 20, partial [Pseudolycoriella hygida]
MDSEEEALLEGTQVKDEQITDSQVSEKDFKNENVRNGNCNIITSAVPSRRSDEPTELSFEKNPENEDERKKRQKIENALSNPNTTLEEWKYYAISEYGLINDDLRRKVWPLLVGIDPEEVEPAPTLDELKTHPEYNQVILDVNRSLKRFPPGIPYEQRIALQDQLTVLILRVIIKYPHLKYYQGYHDVAVTFLLVVGDEIAFHVMEILSTNHLVECMQETMEPTQKRLMSLYPLLRREKPYLSDYLERSTVGTLFALPWYLTWFGHSLNSYRSVVRLYDYFLASPILLPLYVTAAIVLYREDDIFKEDCDMASMHCVLSKLPEDLPFEYLLKQADALYKKYPPDLIEKDVDEMIAKEKLQRKLEQDIINKRRRQIQRKSNATISFFKKILPGMLQSRKSMFVTTAFSILV